tara:strand:- start:6129 stop:6704 length:576 start_codon:yes stop_codon:yes gene_type:complete
VNRNDDGSVLEGCGEMGPEGPMDTSQLTPEEAFTAGMSAARDAIDQALGDPDGPWLPEEGGFSGNGPMGEPAMQETALEEVDFQDTGSGSSPDPQAAMRALLQKALEIYEYTAPLSYGGVGHAVVARSGESLSHDQPNFGEDSLDDEDWDRWEKLDKEFDDLHTAVYGDDPNKPNDLRYIADALAAAGAYK